MMTLWTLNSLVLHATVKSARLLSWSSLSKPLAATLAMLSEFVRAELFLVRSGDEQWLGYQNIYDLEIGWVRRRLGRKSMIELQV